MLEELSSPSVEVLIDVVECRLLEMAQERFWDQGEFETLAGFHRKLLEIAAGRSDVWVIPFQYDLFAAADSQP